MSSRGADMTVDEAYRKGQEDMRRRIEDYWRNWSTFTPSGYDRATRPGRKSRPNFSATIRKVFKLRALQET